MQISKLMLAVVIVIAGGIGWFIGHSQGASQSFDGCHAATVDYSQAMQAYQNANTPQNSQRQHEALEIYKAQCDR